LQDERGLLKHTQELFWQYWLPLLMMLTLIAMESTDTWSGGHTFNHLQRICLWMGIHLSTPHLELLNKVIRKSGHMVGYGMLGFLWLLLLRGTYWLQHDYSRSLQGRVHVLRMWWRAEWAGLAVSCTFLVAAADELHQMSIPSRSGSWWDVAIDTSAGLVAVLLVRAKAGWVCRDEPPLAVDLCSSS
jgi:VanZ family protein